MKVVVVDYGSGNLRSVAKALSLAVLDINQEYEVVVSADPDILRYSDYIVLPGVGAFGDCFGGLSKTDGMMESLNDAVMARGVPFLGICVGMQLLALSSEENGNHKGLGWIKGHIKKLPSQNLKMPHMGWNKIKIVNKNTLIKPEETDYYFVHSYYFDCLNKQDIVAETEYGINFASIVNKENVYGCQFHPEKSSTQGLNIIKDFISL